MSLFGAAERFAAIDRSAVTVDAKRCLHAQDKFSTCAACFEMCPVEAIQAGKPPSLEAQKCVSCLACLPACPVGAYAADDAVSSLLNCAPRLESGTAELLCKQHPQPENGWSRGSIAIRLRGCLAGLGAGAYVALSTLGLERVVIRLDACVDCPWGSLKAQIESQLDLARKLLQHWGRGDTFELGQVLDEISPRPVWEADNPPLSRRDLFRMAAWQGQVAVARAMEMDHVSGDRKPGRDRLRILSAVAHLPAGRSDQDPILDAGSFAILSISDACTACQACARACPTAALQFMASEDKVNYQLMFKPTKCIGCEVCVHVCAPAAIVMNHAPSFSQVFDQTEPVILRQGELIRCQHCGSLFAARLAKQRLCPVCEYRRDHPFGSILPPGLKIPVRPQPEDGHDR